MLSLFCMKLYFRNTKNCLSNSIICLLQVKVKTHEHYSNYALFLIVKVVLRERFFSYERNLFFLLNFFSVGIFFYRI